MYSTYIDFLSTVPTNLKPFVDSFNAYLIDHQCKRTIKEAAKRYLVSYVLPSTGKTLLNFVFRKGCVKVRIYAIHVAQYQDLLNAFPALTKTEIANALDSKKLTGKTCSPTCPAGYTFVMDGVEYKKCRSIAFLPTLNEGNNPIIRKMIEAEVTLSATRD